MIKITFIKRIGLAILLMTPFIFGLAQSEINKFTSPQYIISKIEPHSAIVKINGKRCKLGSIFEGSDTIQIPSNAAIRVKELVSKKHSDIKGGKLLKLKIKTFNSYKQLNTKGINNLEAISNYLNRENWLMISDTAFIDFPASLSFDEYFILKSIPKLIEFRPLFNYANGEITITKSDLINIGIYNDNDSIMQFQVEVHNSAESLFVTDSLKIELISNK